MWHGTILSYDKALQLLLIVDYICELARDEYRWNVLSCLAGSEISNRFMTPVSTVLSSSSEPIPNGDATLGMKASEVARTIDLTQDERDVEMEDAIIDEVSPAKGANNRQRHENVGKAAIRGPDLEQRAKPMPRFNLSSLSLFTYRGSTDKSWCRWAAISHSSLVDFVFSHAQLPEDSDSLSSYLGNLKLTGDIEHRPCKLLKCFRKNSITIRGNRVREFERCWTGTEAPPSSWNSFIMPAIAMFHTYVRRSDWRIVRDLHCVTATVTAMKTLASLACSAGNVLPRKNIRPDCSEVPIYVRDARSLSGLWSLKAALAGLKVFLLPDTQGGRKDHVIWAKASEVMPELLIAEPWNLLSRRSSLRRERLLHKTVPLSLKTFVNYNFPWSGEGTIVLKYLRGPDDRPSFCLMVFDDELIEDEPAFGVRLGPASDLGFIHVTPLRVRWKTENAKMSPSDKLVIETWIDILNKKQSRVTEWPF